MSKRADRAFERVSKDDYPTPAAAVEPLLRQLPPGSYFVEPCVGEGRLAEHLVAAGHRCAGAYGLPELMSSLARGNIGMDEAKAIIDALHVYLSALPTSDLEIKFRELGLIMLQRRQETPP
jgi:hypothetical protein